MKLRSGDRGDRCTGQERSARHARPPTRSATPGRHVDETVPAATGDEAQSSEDEHGG